MILRRRGVALAEALEALGEAAELGADTLPQDAVVFASSVLDKAAERMRHGSDNTLVALLGATGSGKSSLANALAGSEIATTGIRRPTTNSTLGLLWGDDDRVQSGNDLLTWLEVASRHHVGTDDELDGLVVLDVPDHDSVEVSHRLEMERIAEQADLLLWVTDHEKYADAAMHRYLRYLAGHDAVVTVVLNKIDQLSEADQEACRTDLARLLVADGVESATVVTTSTVTGAGIAEVRRRLGRAVADRTAMTDRLAADVAVAASELAEGLGGEQESSVDKRAVSTLTDALVEASGLDAVVEAVSASVRRDAAATMGWPFTRWARRLRPDPLRRLHLDSDQRGRSSLPRPTGARLVRAEGAIRDFADATTSDLGEPWPTLVRAAARPDDGVLADHLDAAVAEAARDLDLRRPRWWRPFGWLQTLLAVATIVGVAWLAGLFAAAWLQLPDPPTPEIGPVPVPTVLFLGGIGLGLFLALVSRRLAGLSARRGARRARAEAKDNVTVVANELIADPVRRSLADRQRLASLLDTAGADARLTGRAAEARR